MKVRFAKMHGVGNDFVMIDDRDGTFPVEKGTLAAIGARGTGVGCEGIILVQKSETADFRMRFFNPDGSEAEMCGNGARCVAAFARAIGAVATDAMRFETIAGEVRAEIVGPSLVRIELPAPKDLRTDFVNSGVPHKIVPVEDLEAADVAGEGRRIRYSAEFAPAGTNVDFVRYAPPHDAFIRTYERGVEAETGACGTGSVAAAVVGVAQYGLSFPVAVHTAKGFELTIDGAFDGERFSSVTLTGPVAHVFDGELEPHCLVPAGYQKVASALEEGRCRVAIPNHEIAQVFVSDIKAKINNALAHEARRQVELCSEPCRH